MGTTGTRKHGEEEPTEPEEEKWIDRSKLNRKLGIAAQVRSIITLLSFVLFLGVAILIIAKFPGAADQTSPWPACVVFGPTLLVGWLVTVTLCRKMVLCPHCGNSLWGCGTGNFKPRRMRVRNDIHCCPHCKAPFG